VLPQAALAGSGEFNFGVFPQLSARVLAETFQPMADYLGNALKQPVILESAPDFFTFHARTLNREYDLVFTAPHMAWLAWKEGGYKPILTYAEPAQGYVVVRVDSPYRQLQDLRGKTIAIPDPNAVINIRIEKIMAKAGLDMGRELKVIEVGSHTNAATHVNEKRADAAIVGRFPFLRLPKEVRGNLRIIAETPALPSLTFLVHPRATPAREQAIRQVIESFMQSEAGKTFLQKTGSGGVRPLKKNELQQVENDAQEFNQRFQAQTHPAGKPK
jgi:phosphonate transport system substrate-binding protein